MIKFQDLIEKAYSAFNARNLDEVLTTFHPDVEWSNGWEGGYVYGHEGVKNYWTRQWKELDPHVTPVSFVESSEGKVLVEVHQTVKDWQGILLFEGTVHHIFTLESALIRKMDIEKP